MTAATSHHLVDELPDDQVASAAEELRGRTARHPDASVVAIAKRLGVSEVATLKRRDFAYVRPRHTEAFTLLPERLASR